ncbi:hypothetical protein G6F65_014588 [Rhizopus arrhizus]|nr:hypothetical protein G6F65_014588 [Rhizopus arrhizus]
MPRASAHRRSANCLGGTPPRGSAANCAALGVPAGFQQANSQISVTTGGNRELDPERSRSFSAGFVWSPWFGNTASWSARFDVEVPFYRHAIDGAIQAINAQTQLDLCVDTLDPIYCNGITRASTGAVSSFNNRLTNLGSIKTDGWDVDLFWTLPQTSIGQFKLAWKNTFVGRYEATGAAGQKQPQKPGVEVADSSIPEWTSNASIGWTMDRWSANWTVRHISELTENCGDAAVFPVCSNQAAGTNTLSATTFHDMQVGYKIDWMKGLQLTAGLNNVFDKDPPICLSCSLNGYDASTYDIPQRPGKGQRAVAAITEGAVTIDLRQVFLVQQVVEVGLHAELRRDAVAHEGADQRIAALLDAAIGRHRVVDAVLPVGAAADGQFLQRLRGVAGEQLQRGLRQVGVDVAAVDVLGHVARCAEGGIPARCQLAVHFELEAAADGAPRGNRSEFAGPADDRFIGGLGDVAALTPTS